ncbi:hypothetical protein EV424DRAFT_1349179 [Suillus variegatus]|nr:hypothetical protein EV424DRAFT_1349179 [Suillus variegatus]
MTLLKCSALVMTILAVMKHYLASQSSQIFKDVTSSSVTSYGICLSFNITFNLTLSIDFNTDLAIFISGDFHDKWKATGDRYEEPLTILSLWTSKPLLKQDLMSLYRDEEIPDAPPPEPQPRYRARYEAPPPDPDEEPSDDEEDQDSDEDMPRPTENKIGTPPDFNRERDTSSKFIRLLCGKAGITNFAAKKDYFLRGLKPKVVQKICDSGDIPDTFDGLVRKVVNMESAYQLLMSH